MSCLLYRGSKDFQSAASESNRLVLTIGNFDGMHLGHKSLFDEVIQLAKEELARPTLVSFYPHPKLYFERKKFPHSDSQSSFHNNGILTPPRQKLFRASTYEMGALVLLRFSDALANLYPEEFFIKKIFPLGTIAGIVVGGDWHFGKDKSGNVNTLLELSQKYKFKIKIIPDKALNNERISSSLIRKMIAAGDISSANNYLGYTYLLSGKVRRGDQRGRLLGFPTMNLAFKEELLPQFGVYRTSVLIEGEWLPSITNVGIRPTFSGSSPVVETHVLSGYGRENYSRENYGERIDVKFIDRIRAEHRFSNIDELKMQIGKDIQTAKKGHFG